MSVVVKNKAFVLRYWSKGRCGGIFVSFQLQTIWLKLVQASPSFRAIGRWVVPPPAFSSPPRAYLAGLGLTILAAAAKIEDSDLTSLTFLISYTSRCQHGLRTAAVARQVQVLGGINVPTGYVHALAGIGRTRTSARPAASRSPTPRQRVGTRQAQWLRPGIMWRPTS